MIPLIIFPTQTLGALLSILLVATILLANTIIPLSMIARSLQTNQSTYHPHPLISRDAKAGLTVSQLLQIAPSATTCTNAPFPSECTTAETAVPALNAAFTTYNITSPSEIAALISLQAFESAEFKYNKNHFPGRPGQGTVAMLMPSFIAKYAASLREIGGKASTLNPNAVLELISQWDVYNFGSAAWFLATRCSAEIRTGLQRGGQAGWESYVTNCVGTTVTAERAAYWNKASSAVGALVGARGGTAKLVCGDEKIEKKGICWQ